MPFVNCNALRCVAKKQKERFATLSPFLILNCELFSLDCANGASVFASAAVYTFVVDNVNTVITQGNCAYGAGFFTSAASNAFVRNDMCHCCLPPFFAFCVYYITFFLISKGLRQVFG
jgi:hypothetical protein